MKKQVSIIRKKRLMEYLNSEEHKCVTHKERKTIFCDKNRILLCQLCSDSQEHRGHTHCSINVAVVEQMEKLLKQMDSLWKRIGIQQNYVEIERRTALLWLDYVKLREEMIRKVYRKLCPSLNEEEDQHIECMRHQSNTILEELRKSEAMIVHERSQLVGVYRELMTMSQKPYEVLLLQDLDDLFRRSELAANLDMQQGMIPRLGAHPNPGLTARFNSFRVKISFKHLIILSYTSIIPLDIRRLHENTCLDSAENHRASWGKSFSTGKYYWEVDLKDYEKWAVGVCNSAWIREGNYVTTSEGAFILECLRNEGHYSLITRRGVEHYIEKPVGRVGMFLDCEGGYVSFLDVAKSSLIHSYSPGTFHCAVKPFFSVVYT
ncbi:tripartite motif-containing protein 43B-like [Mus pahari]|uniref:tripartite motif-containing protein 43B-like n=1 Tax=Mus pahari TaxID=10093 RepID=UPI000A308299|nr:tripartite motif-containing protein 43B-like [Mus pahari]